MIVPAGNYLVLAAALFVVGLVGVLIRHNLIVMFMCIELMLNSVNLTFVAFSRMNGNLDGQILSFFVIAVAAAEVTVGLALIVNLFRLKASIDADEARSLRQ